MKNLSLAVLLCSTILFGTPTHADPIKDAVAHQDRPAKQRIRDEFRHPQQTLRFFGIKPDMKVVEVWPGGGWYTNILAPLLKENGKLYAAHFYIDENSNSFYKKSRKAFENKVKTMPNYSGIEVTEFHPSKNTNVAPAGTADVVLTFRNLHNWNMGKDKDALLKAFKTFHKALKKGGVLGVVEHRLRESLPNEMEKTSGYMKQSNVIKIAMQAGFELAASSEVNANPSDSTDHPRGVWTLPPRLALDKKDREKYMNIGESDRMTLKFVKK